MRRKFALLLLATIIALSHQISTPESSHYVAGVVEFTSDKKIGVQRVQANMEAYKEIIASEEAKNVDILVFPEATLNTKSFSTFVPHPDDEIAPCDGENFEFFLRNISCSARTHKKYIVINLTEKHLCTEEEQEALNDDRPCAENGLSYYNTNVVMNRNGTVVSRYRKFHPFGETGINTTITADISIFTTDFGVTFGHFICFDILFDDPPLKLLEAGVKDIIFPSLWYSELPYLTAVQTQYMWAWKHNVNFLGAGGNNPNTRSTGSGIFAGRKGPLTYVMASTTMRKLLVANVPKAHTLEGPYTHDPVAVKSTEEQMLNLRLLRDFVDIYTTKLVDVSKKKGSEKLCFDTLCCDFNYELIFDDSLLTNGSDYFRYRMAVFDGVRSYYNVETGGVFSCGLITCPTDDLESCATRFDASVNVVNPVTFTSIKISGTFPSNPHILTMPNTLDNVILPIDYNKLHYEECEERIVDGESYKDITLELIIPRNDIRTFAIYGRNFEKDGQNVTTSGASSSVLASTLMFL
ncbi:vanin-like protein 1 [Phlebotomus argentipes]|uniref:vanin-like protein 1 n=1 Tax=Phlebotomus argentipes TaxID=94469 RepID=UPI0028933A06|nr:vanin-like protein 1 [Phlebotomus argentipes]